MQQLTTVIVFGEYGAGKTRLVHRLALESDSDAQAVALVQQTGPVNLDPLWLPGFPVVALEQSCACEGGAELVGCLELLRERGCSLALVEVGGDLEPEPLARAVSGLAETEVLVVPAQDVAEGEGMEALAERYLWVEGAGETAPDNHGDHAGHGDGGGCNCGHEGCGDDHHHGGCTCEERRADPQWMPFWYADAVEGERLCKTLEGLPEGVLRAKGLLWLEEEGWLLVDRAGGRVSHRVLKPDALPELYDPDSLAEDEQLPAAPPEGGALLLLWTRLADEAASVALEWEVAGILAECFGVEEDPAEAMAFAAESMDNEELVFEALSAARAAALALPTAAEPVELLAKGYHALMENERAMVLLREAARRDPQHRSSLLNAARMHLAYEETEEAGALAERVLADHPQDPDAHAVAGESLVLRGELQRAAPHLEAAAEGMPEDDVLRSMLCSLYAERGEHRQALQWNSEVLSLDPEDEGAHYLRGELLLRLSRPEDAAEALEHALALGNESPWVMTALGIAQLQSGAEEEAAGCFADAFVLAQEQLEQLPDDSSAVDLLLAATFRGRLDQIPELWQGLEKLDPRELAKAQDTLSLAPDRGEAPRVLEAIAKILIANER